jgi:hypothetical protein
MQPRGDVEDNRIVGLACTGHGIGVAVHVFMADGTLRFAGKVVGFGQKGNGSVLHDDDNFLMRGRRCGTDPLAGCVQLSFKSPPFNEP